MKPKVGMTVQYFTHRTRENGPNTKRLEQPVPLGPWAAVITEVGDVEGTVTLSVTPPRGRSYPVFNVTRTPSTPVQHYWGAIPDDEE